MSKQLARRILEKELEGTKLLAAIAELRNAKTLSQIEEILDRYTNSV